MHSARLHLEVRDQARYQYLIHSNRSRQRSVRKPDDKDDFWIDGIIG